MYKQIALFLRSCLKNAALIIHKQDNGASLNDYLVKRQNCLMMGFLRSQNDVLIGKIHFTMIGSLLREPIFRQTTIFKQLISGSKMAACCEKWLPAVLQDGFLTIQSPENGCPMEDLCFTMRYLAHWNALKGFQCVSMGF